MNLLLDRNDSATEKLARTSVSFATTTPTDEELFSIRCPLENDATLSGQNPSVETCDTTNTDGDWFEMALQTEAPRNRPVMSISPLAVAPVKNSWGDDEEEADEELTEDDTPEDDDEPDPFEDFDEDDFDDDFDDDFEEELEDEYEIEPKDDGFAVDDDTDEVDPELLEDDDAPDEIAE